METRLFESDCIVSADSPPIVCFVFGRCDVTDWLKQSVVVKPIELLRKHIQSEYPDSVVLVVFADENGLFEKGVLEAIFEKEVLKVLCGDISEIVAIELPKSIAGEEASRLLRIISENSIEAIVYEKGKIIA